MAPALDFLAADYIRVEIGGFLLCLAQCQIDRHAPFCAALAIRLL
jgi:hypothetical protein